MCRISNFQFFVTADKVLLRAVANVVKGNVVVFVKASNTELLALGLEFRLVIIVAMVVSGIDAIVEFNDDPILVVIPIGNIVIATCFIIGNAVVVKGIVVVAAVVFMVVINVLAVVVIGNDKLIIDGGNGLYG